MYGTVEMQSLLLKVGDRVARQVKCFYCKEKEDGDLLHCEETVKNNKTTRRYFHHSCYDLYIAEKELKQIEMQKWDQLYQHVLKIHNLTVLDGRMIEKLQDLRNGSVKYGGKKIVRHKDGVEYDVILETYRQQGDNIEWNIRNRDFEGRKWNEFSYIFSIVLSKVNDVKLDMETKRKQDEQLKVKITDNVRNLDTEDTIINPVKKKDELDISAFL